jgi:hypothetical protein
MSQENVEVVRRLNTPHEGEDVIPLIRESLERFGPYPQPDTVLAEWAKDPGWQHMHPEIEWDVSATGVFGTVAHGPRELALWWADWAEAWDSYVYRISEYRDLGDWVLTLTDVRARGRGGIPVEMRTFELYQARDAKVARYRAFLSEQEALEAAGLSE